MTAPSAPREQRPRVSDEDLADILAELKAGKPAIASDTDDVVRELIAARAEIAQLRKAVAMARRDGWIAGRDAAAKLVEQEIDEPDEELGTVLLTRWDEGPEIGEAIRALAPPAAADGECNDD